MRVSIHPDYNYTWQALSLDKKTINSLAINLLRCDKCDKSARIILANCCCFTTKSGKQNRINCEKSVDTYKSIYLSIPSKISGNSTTTMPIETVRLLVS